jgi:phosphatidylglycerol:prolipoprotein diacylglycerol transferase
MNSLLYIVWNADPTLFTLGPLTIRWYGLFFALAFFTGYTIMQRMLKREGLPIQWMDSLLIYMMVGTIAGARLGHVFFYQWDYYRDNLMEIPMVWEGGLASHGAAIGIILALWLWSRRISKLTVLWSLDRIVILVALSGMFIRTGNFFNHEIVGKPTQTESGVKFVRNYDDFTTSELASVTKTNFWNEDGEADRSLIDKAYNRLTEESEFASVLEAIPNRYPAQLYEAGIYLLVSVLLMLLYLFTTAGARPGLLFGLFLTITFVARFFIEFYKEVQVEFEQDMRLMMGQWLSIPFVLIGIGFIVRSAMQPKKNAA